MKNLKKLSKGQLKSISRSRRN
ncbi:bacteriocin-like protein [Chryseobacterium wanjuense]